ncbi:CTLH/CRA C-terminal to lish motif domain-containing protein [Tricharina praecox]|uniref:CTLH/CRA C-terminal to lish motif domain-containing protein n=1 Tax=Tricharina praecox TaxID=43433 RepID=UPI00221F3CFF|nr:CTLH/CRA C-terminal to lish motif domain-containing protein [Tricharina praecox]KAI5858789.1 CTLH/CRA C-terminal to lish motif domain-containing protein [Tricharina praecox]
MDAIQAEFDRLNNKSNLSKAVTDIDKCIALLENARNQIAQEPSSRGMTLARLQQSVNSQLEKVGGDHKEVYTALNRYGKALDKKFKAASAFSSSDYDALSNEGHLINRAIAMHLIREGQFTVASKFVQEAGDLDIPPELQDEFVEMYQILKAMKEQRDLDPAIAWARQKARQLEQRGSNLEFDLCKLQFVAMFVNGMDGRKHAMEYARREFGRFQDKHLKEVQMLMTAFLYTDNLQQSPYGRPFLEPEKTWEDVAHSFTKEFCSLLGLSAQSPLYLAATAGAIALPTLLKMTSIMKEKKTEWTSQNELPVEIPLPPSYHFHSIFVCPVSKDQTTEENPPMMLPCGHVIALESLQRLARSGSAPSLKCPYCPKESTLAQAKQVII